MAEVKKKFRVIMVAATTTKFVVEWSEACSQVSDTQQL